MAFKKAPKRFMQARKVEVAWLLPTTEKKTKRRVRGREKKLSMTLPSGPWIQVEDRNQDKK